MGERLKSSPGIGACTRQIGSDRSVWTRLYSEDEEDSKTRLTPVPDAELGWFIRLLRWVSDRKMRLNQSSKALNFLAHNKKVLYANVSYMAMLSQWRRLPPRLKRLVHLRVAMRVGCPF